MWKLEEVSLEVLKEEGNYGEFKFAPLESGFGLTLGTAIRRILLSSIVGVAPVGIYIDGVIHEFSTIEGVVEDVEQIILNVKKLILSMEAIDKTILRFEKTGEGELKASDLIHTSEVTIHNPDLHIATISSSKGRLSGEIYIRRGKGYLLEDAVEKLEDFPQTVIPIDANFSPVVKATFRVEPTRFEESVDFDALIVGVQTKGNKSPRQCLIETINVLLDYSNAFNKLLNGSKVGDISDDVKNMKIEELNLPERAYNVLVKNNINTVGDLIKYSAKDLLDLDKFGTASLKSVEEALSKLGLKLKE
ncbi:DNA-directed RNA polymerase subunit alpha [Caldisericum exile]|uniref:DNA-directed RNA polymerase subunit alpha n=1 Tax=Caldisericum exile (strain DSM 21853 / NBRC 104410 / AZM16c01) TaxID=511051 RepID=A0A7U6GF41_CALEA|nr:DNA-directed RNA polymerase subunit alpha [Caldisericum exile]BAL81240.1 DNA-directed RNA polymerase subunit alpha [Caldisericum exile AZM16c01]